MSSRVKVKMAELFMSEQYAAYYHNMNIMRSKYGVTRELASMQREFDATIREKMKPDWGRALLRRYERKMEEAYSMYDMEKTKMFALFLQKIDPYHAGAYAYLERLTNMWENSK